MGSLGIIAGSPPPRVFQFRPTDWKSNVTGALQMYSNDLGKLLSQNPNFTVNDFVRYYSPPGGGWHTGAQLIGARVGAGFKESDKNFADFLQKQLQGMAGKKLHDFLQAEIQKAIDTTNKVAQGGPGIEGVSGDEIIDAQEREQLRQQSPVAAAVLDYVVESYRW